MRDAMVQQSSRQVRSDESQYLRQKELNETLLAENGTLRDIARRKDETIVQLLSKLQQQQYSEEGSALRSKHLCLQRKLTAKQRTITDLLAFLKSVTSQHGNFDCMTGPHSSTESEKQGGMRCGGDRIAPMAARGVEANDATTVIGDRRSTDRAVSGATAAMEDQSATRASATALLPAQVRDLRGRRPEVEKGTGDATTGARPPSGLTPPHVPAAVLAAAKAASKGMVGARRSTQRRRGASSDSGSSRSAGEVVAEEARGGRGAARYGDSIAALQALAREVALLEDKKQVVQQLARSTKVDSSSGGESE